jgi:hypothetical protein
MFWHVLCQVPREILFEVVTFIVRDSTPKFRHVRLYCFPNQGDRM